MFSNLFSITLPNIGKYFLGIHFLYNLLFFKKNYFPANKLGLKNVLIRKWTLNWRNTFKPSGFPTMSSPVSVTSRRRVWRWHPLSQGIQPQSRRCSGVSVNNSQLCSGARLSCTGTLARKWTRWNLPRLRVTWTIWLLSISKYRDATIDEEEFEEEEGEEHGT